MRHLKFLLLLVSTGAVMSCGSREAPPTARDQQALTTCATGAWIRNEHVCNCQSGSLLDGPECGAPDCRESDALILRSDGTATDFVYRSSEAKSSFSIVGGRVGVIVSRWSISNEFLLVQDFGSRSYKTEMDCAGDGLTRRGAASYKRANANDAATFERSASAGWATVGLR